MAQQIPDMLTKNGEITGKPMFQLRGQDHWHSSPAIARAVYNREQAFINKGGWKGQNK